MARIVSRAEWGARSPRSRVAMPWSAVEATFVHYTAGPESQTVRAIQAFHMDTQGWSDIAYSWLVDQSGDIYEGRGWNVAGGHTQGWNSRSHAVCWIGNQGTPSDAALRSMAWLVSEADRLAGRPLNRWPHKHVNSTSCPGPLTPWVLAGCPMPGGPEPETPTRPKEDDMTPAQEAKLDRALALVEKHEWVNENILLPAIGRVDLNAAIMTARKAEAVVDPSAIAASIKEAFGPNLAAQVVDELGRQLRAGKPAG